MVQRTFYALPSEAPPEEPAQEPIPDDVHTLRHGYNLADLDRLARMSTRRIWGLTHDYLTRFETARSAIAEHLYATEARPAPGDLVYVGATAIGRHSQEEQRHHGLGRGYDAGFTPKFTVYWDWVAAVHPGFEAGVIERTTLWQIWGQLGAHHREPLAALATHGTYQAGAAALGLNYGAFQVRISRARARFLQLWHEGENPSRVWGQDRRVAPGGAPASRANGRASQAIRRRAARQAPRRQPTHGKLSTYDQHSCRCDLCLEAAAARLVKRRAKSGANPKKRVSEAQKQEIRDRVTRGESVTEIVAATGLSQATVYRHLRGSARGRAVDAV